MSACTLPEMIRIPFDDEPGRRRLLAEGWREIEILETWDGEAPPEVAIPTALRFRLAEPEDGSALGEIAASSFTHDRLHMDPAVAPAAAAEAKRKWVGDALADRLRTVLVASGASAPVGFLAWKRIKLRGRNAMLVDLLAVASRCRRQGVAGALVGQGLKHSGFRLLRAGTQATNAAAKSFYENLGMGLVRRQRTFHRDR